MCISVCTVSVYDCASVLDVILRDQSVLKWIYVYCVAMHTFKKLYMQMTPCIVRFGVHAGHQMEWIFSVWEYPFIWAVSVGHCGIFSVPAVDGDFCVEKIAVFVPEPVKGGITRKTGFFLLFWNTTLTVQSFLPSPHRTWNPSYKMMLFIIVNRYGYDITATIFFLFHFNVLITF